MKILIEIETDLFDLKHHSPKAAAAQVACILERLIHGQHGQPANGFIARGVVGGDLIALHDASGTHVGAYTTRCED
jgi:hypothetical protein